VTPLKDPNAQTDGVMVSHIRFQGFQGNIRATNPPHSALTLTALSQLLAVNPWQSWRSTGGPDGQRQPGQQSRALFL
jgi:beta-N-acetylhexosaminidase